MEPLLTTFMAFGLAADAFTVSLSSGLIIRHIKFNKALKIALFFGGFQGLMLLVGWGAGLGFRNWLSGIDHWIAFGLLCLVGGKMIHESLSQTDDKPFNPLDFYTLLVLAIATSIDALAAGLGLSMVKMSMIFAVTLVGGVTFSLSFIGVFIGHRFGNLFNEKIGILGGLILILIGGKILLEHLS